MPATVEIALEGEAGQYASTDWQVAVNSYPRDRSRGSAVRCERGLRAAVEIRGRRYSHWLGLRYPES